MKKQKELKYVTIDIEQDDSAGNPRDEFDNLSTFYSVRNSRYLTGGKDDIEYTYRDDLEDMIKDLERAGAVVVPFTSNAGDSYAVIDRYKIAQEYKGYSLRSALYHARQAAKGEINEFRSWANGEVYGYIIRDNETGEVLESVWGFYGDEKYCRSEAESAADSYESERAEQLRAIDNRLMKVSE